MQNLGQFFVSKAHEYTLPKAIKEGYLSPIKALTIPIKLDLNSVKQTAGDFNAKDVGNVLDPYLERLLKRWPIMLAQERLLFSYR